MMKQEFDVRLGRDPDPWTAAGAADGVQRCTVFAGERMVASGTIESVTRTIGTLPFPIDELDLKAFDDVTGQQIPFAFIRRARGRPRLGGETRAVMLLPRHWDWVASQPGGASAHLRKLVERGWREAARREPLRHAAEALTRFASEINFPLANTEAACTAVMRGDLAGAAKQMEAWPQDVRNYALHLFRSAGLLP